MPFAVEIFFEESAELRIRDLWNALEVVQNPSRMKAGGFRPHVTLAVFDEYAAAFETEFQTFTQDLPAFSLCFPNLGIFPKPEGVVFFSAILSAELNAIHQAFHGRLANFLAGSRNYYQPGQWVPHCTLGIGLTDEEIPPAVRLFTKEPLPLMAGARALGLVEFPVHREVVTFPIQGELKEESSPEERPTAKGKAP